MVRLVLLVPLEHRARLVQSVLKAQLELPLRELPVLLG